MDIVERLDSTVLAVSSPRVRLGGDVLQKCGKNWEEVRPKLMTNVFLKISRTIFQAIWVQEFIKFLDEVAHIFHAFACRYIHIFDPGGLGSLRSVHCSATGQQKHVQLQREVSRPHQYQGMD